MTTESKRQGFAEIALDDLDARRTRSAHGTIIAIYHQGTRVLLLLDSGEQLPLTVAEARRLIEQARKNIIGWAATYHGATLTLVERVAA